MPTVRNAEVGKDGAHGLSALDTYDVAAARAFIEKIPPRVIEEDSISSTLAEFG